MGCTLIPCMKSVGKIVSEIWPVFLRILKNLTLIFGQGHRHLGHWMPIYGLYLGTKYEVCRWNNIWDMASCLVVYPFLVKFDLDLWSISTWVIGCACMGCTLVPSMKSVGEIASKIRPVFWFFTHCWENLTLIFDVDLGSRLSTLRSLNAPYWVIPWYEVWSL